MRSPISLTATFAKSPDRIWELFNLADHYNTRPSVLANIENPAVAYCFDRGVNHFGSTLKSEIESRTRKAKNDSQARAKAGLVINEWMSRGPKGQENTKGRYKTPTIA